MSENQATEKNLHAGHRERLRERFVQSGLDDFARHEVIELLLTYTIPRQDVNQTAHTLIDRFGSVAGVLDALPEELQEVEGVGPKTIVFFKLLPATYRRYVTEKCAAGEPMDTVAKVGDYLHALYTGVTVERVYLLLFDNSMRLIECRLMCEGSVNCSHVTVRCIAEAALTKRAACAVLAHNHPGGMAIPSGTDREVTDVIFNALGILNIPLLEHIIVTENTYSPILRTQKGMLRASPVTGEIDEGFYTHFYDEDGAFSRLI